VERVCALETDGATKKSKLKKVKRKLTKFLFENFFLMNLIGAHDIAILFKAKNTKNNSLKANLNRLLNKIIT